MSDSDFFHLHAHSEFSTLDALTPVENMVNRVAMNKQPALALTDHGVMSGTTRLYKLAQKAGIKAFPGEEFYVVTDVDNKMAPRRHMTIVALNLDGYRGLVELSTKSHERANYHYKPRIDHEMLAEFGSKYGDDIIAMTGCYFGVLVQEYLENGMKGAKALMRFFGSIFPNLYIEIQRHGIDLKDQNDVELSERLWELASKDGGYPVVVTQDSHYERITEKPLHDFFKQIAYVSAEDQSFPGTGYHLASTRWVKSHYEDGIGDKIWNASLQSMKHILDQHSLVMPALDEYTFRVPISSAADADQALHHMAFDALKDSGFGKKYKRRVEYELDIISAQGFADYFILIEDIVSWCRAKGIFVQARGSASGSLVCFLLGITQVDPIKWDLMFERFLSRDRTKPPDIDLDIEDWRREEVINYVKKTRETMQMGTFQRLGLNDEGKGSLFVQFMSTKRKELGVRFVPEYGSVKSIYDLTSEEQEILEKLASYRPRKSAGGHAAGFVVSGEGQALTDYLPGMLIPSSGNQVTQMVMEDVEELGYVKLDLLGQRTLSTVRQTMVYLGRDPDLGLDWIPMNDTKTLTQVRQKNTVGVFQLEGWSARSGCAEMKVKTTMDIIYVMALYRPATIDSGYKDTFLNNKRKDTRAKGRRRGGMNSTLDYPDPIFEKHLAETFGVAVFQEQIMLILRDIGVDVEELNAFLKALKSSNDKAAEAYETFQTSRKHYIELAVQNTSMDKKSAKESWDMIAGFSGYGFNKSHGVAYGLLAYRTAYLKTHHPLEYMAALLETSVATNKELDYQKEARRLGLKILAPDVNVSSISWSLDSKGIRRGLMSIKGIGAKAADELIKHQPYKDIKDLIERVPAKQVTGGRHWASKGTLNGALEILRVTGALRSLGIQP